MSGKVWDDDLVTELRSHATDDECPSDQQAFRDAADEIERLGKKVEELAAKCDYFKGECDRLVDSQGDLLAVLTNTRNAMETVRGEILDAIKRATA